MDTMSEAANPTSPVRAVREALGITQTEMADKIGCSHTSERRFEYDGTLPRNKAVLKNLQRLAKQAGVKLEAEATST